MYWVTLITPFVAQIEYLENKLILIFLWSSCTLVYRQYSLIMELLTEAVDEFIEINEFSSWYFHKLVPKTESPQTLYIQEYKQRKWCLLASDKNDGSPPYRFHLQHFST